MRAGDDDDSNNNAETTEDTVAVNFHLGLEKASIVRVQAWVHRRTHLMLPRG